MEKSVGHPPRWAQRLVEWYCKPKLAEDLLGDLNEYFERNVETKGVTRARIIYAIDAIKFIRPYTIRKPKLFQSITNWIMIGSYFKTSGRNVLRNKLFSAINVIGLSISMSVGLLLIAFVHDLVSYDKFHANYDRIYRLNNFHSNNNSEYSEFASTSVLAGQLVREKVTGIEDLTIIRYGFSGDAHIGENIIPVEGHWAEPSFFKVFSFPLSAGNAETALNKPYSLVLSEATAKKLFGNEDAMGKTVHFDSTSYEVTGIMKDSPFFSHLKFEMLISFSTVDLVEPADTPVPGTSAKKKSYLAWDNMWQNYVYMTLSPGTDPKSLQTALTDIADEQNAKEKYVNIKLALQHMPKIALGERINNSIGSTMSMSVVWIVTVLGFVVILSACFNYTNLSIARSLRRFKEVGLRKVIGAGRKQVRQQFIVEAVIVSVAALIVAFALFLLLRERFVSLAPEISKLVLLDLTPMMVVAFILFGIFVGIMAGLLPAIFFSKVSIIHALKDASSVKVFKHVTMRKALVVVQYTLTLMFITATVIGYNQYKSMLTFDLGFTTTNILNLKMQGNMVDGIKKDLSELPEVETISHVNMVTSTGSFWGQQLKYKTDSIGVGYNTVDENYFPMHKHKFLAGGNFKAHPTTEEAESETILSELTVKKLNIGGGDPEKAIGEEVLFGKKRLTVVGVLKDFHYSNLQSDMPRVAFNYRTQKKGGVLSMAIQSNDIMATRAKIEEIWNKYDRIHPIKMEFYDKEIEETYSEFSVMVTVIGFLSFLAISIASLGMFGMVVFTTQTRLKEIGIRKVMGATSGNLVYLLGKGFVALLLISALIALPATYIFFDRVLLTDLPYHPPIKLIELTIGLLAVLVLAFLMIGSQTFKAASTNPAEVLKNE